MISTYDINPAFQSFLRPLGQRLHHAGVTPNQLTLAAMAASFCMGAMIYFSGRAVLPFYILPFFLFGRMALNALDGIIAKEHSLCSPFGALFNELADALSDAALYLPFAVLPGIPAAPIVIIVTLAVVSELAGVLAVTIGARRRFDGPMGKSDRAVAFGLFALAYAGGLRTPAAWLAILTAVILLLMFTIIARSRNALREISL